MQAILAIGAVVIVLVLVGYVRARLVVRRRSRDLALASGIRAEQIRRELVRDRLTPGEWAISHGLDPMSFRPTPGSALVLQTWINSNTGEQITAISHGPLRSGEGSVAVAATGDAVFIQSTTMTDPIQLRYAQVGEARVNQPGIFGSPGNFFLGDVGGGRVLADLAHPQAVVDAINAELRSITTFEKRVELASNGGAVFSWRPYGESFGWSVRYDENLIEFGGPSDEIKQATQQAIQELNDEREGT